MLSAVRRAVCYNLLVLGILGSPAQAAPKITEIVQNYSISATTIQGLRREFRTKGPKGFAALTEWEVRWDAACRVTVKVTYTFPNHIRPGAMPGKVKRRYLKMLANLYLHERQHGRHGIAAAREIDRADCQNGKEIIQKYVRADREFDRRTNHGRSDGVRLDRPQNSDR